MIASRKESLQRETWVRSIKRFIAKRDGWRAYKAIQRKLQRNGWIDTGPKFTLEQTAAWYGLQAALAAKRVSAS